MKFPSQIKFIACLTFCLAAFVCVSMIPENNAYNKWSNVTTDIKTFPFHIENAALVVAAKYKLNKNDTSNVAAIGFTVLCNS